MKRKAEDLRGQRLSLDAAYQTKLAYHKAVIEKEALKLKLESEADVKRQLEDSLKERELALKRQEKLVASLYEKERQLKSKLFQLEQAQVKSEENEKELERLKNRAEEINKELDEKKITATDSAKEELDKIGPIKPNEYLKPLSFKEQLKGKAKLDEI